MSRRRVRTIAGATTVLALGFSTAFAQPAPKASLDRLKHDTQVLSSDAFEGRGPMTAGEDKATAYIAHAMQAAGLEPGYHGGYLQPVPVVKTETLTAPVPRLRVTAPKGEAMDFAYGKDVTLNTTHLVDSVDIDLSNVVFVGYGVNAPDKHWNDYAGVDVRGKTVLILINDPDWKNPVGQGPFGGKAMTYYGRWKYKYEEAGRQGAAAAIIIHSDAAAGYPFSVPASSLGGARTDLDRSKDATDALAVAAWMTHPAAERLIRLAGQDLSQLESEASQPGFHARPLDVRADIHFKVRASRGVSHNVVGRLPGAKRPDETVIYTAHWDHLGHCPPDKTGDDICNGAIDNASGVAGLLEMARAFKSAPRTARSIVFISTTGEEQSLFGSEYYATHPLYPLAKTVTELDLDPINFMLGATRDISLIADQTEFAPLVREEAAAQGRVVTLDSSPEQGSRYRSDTLSFSRAGVPAIVLGYGVEVIGKPAGWGQAKLDDYFAHHYHQPSDSYDPNWDWGGALQDFDLNFAIGRRLANASDWPNWLPTDEFRAKRDAVLAAGAR